MRFRRLLTFTLLRIDVPAQLDHGMHYASTIRNKIKSKVVVIYSHYIGLAPVLKTNFHQCVISYTCSQADSDGSVLLATGI